MKEKLFIVTFILPGIFFSQEKWSLKKCVEYAFQNNLQIHNTQYNREIQEMSLKIAKQDYLPSVSGNIGNNANFGQSRDVFGNVRRNDNYSNNASVGANISLYNGGRIKKTVEKSQFELDALSYDLETQKNSIALQIAQQYLQILLNKEIYKIAQSSVENAEKLLKRAKITTEVGTTPLSLQYEAQANLAREKQRLQTSKIDIDRSLFALAQLLQVKDYQSFDIENINVPSQISESMVSLERILEIAYESQPQIKSASTKIAVAQKQTEIAKTNFLPSVSATAGIGSSYFNLLHNQNNLGLFEQYKNNFGQQLGVNVSIPIFNKGITKLQIEQAKVNEKIAENALQIQKQEIKQSIQRAYFDSMANYQNYLSALESEKSNKLAFEFAQKSYEAGRTTIYDYNMSRVNYITSQSTLMQAKYNYLFSLKVLDFYAGIPIESTP